MVVEEGERETERVFMRVREGAERNGRAKQQSGRKLGAREAAGGAAGIQRQVHQLPATAYSTLSPI